MTDKATSTTKRTNRNIILSVSASMVAKLLVLLQSSVIAAVFGANETVDILFYLLGLIVVITTFASAVNHHIIVANAMRIRAGRPFEDYKAFVRQIFTIYLAIALLLASFLFFFGPRFLGLVTAFSPDAIARNGKMVRLMAVVIFFAIVNTFLMDIFASFKIFVLPMVNDMLKSTLIILCIFMVGGNAGVTSIVYGMIAAYVLQFITINVSFAKVAGFGLGLGRYRMQSAMKQNISFVLLTQGISMVESVLIMGAISQFPQGYYTAMSLSRKLSTTVLNMIVLQFATVVGVDLIEHHTGGNRDKLSASFTGYLRAAYYMLMPVVAVCIVNSRGVIALLFGYGRYTTEMMEISAQFLSVISLMMLTGIIDAFLQRLIIVGQLHNKTYVFQLGQSVVRITLIFALSHAMGYIGIPAGLVLSNLLYVLVLGMYLLRKHFDYIRMKATCWHIGVNLLCMAGACGVGWLGLGYFSYDYGFVQKFLYMVASSVAIFAAYIGLGMLYAPNRSALGTIWGFAKNLLGRLRPTRAGVNES